MAGGRVVLSLGVMRYSKMPGEERSRTGARDSMPCTSIPVPRKVAPEDLEQLPQLKALLHALNDPYVGLKRLAMLLDGVPVLKSRCQYQGFLRRPALRVDSSELVLGVIGNKGLEAMLFEVLEDLTILKAELEDEHVSGTAIGREAGKTVTVPRVTCAPLVTPRISYVSEPPARVSRPPRR